MTPPADRFTPFRVSEDEANERLDKLVVRHAAGIGRRGVAVLFERGAVRVDGRVARKGDRAGAHSTVTIDQGELEPVAAEPGASLDVRLETPELVAVEKPAGQPTAPLTSGETGTLAGALLGRYPEMAGVGYRAREPGLLHRLDTQTSGLVIAARRAEVFERLRGALSSGLIEKRYLAVVSAENLPESGVIDAPLSPDAGDSRRVVPSGARASVSCVTRFRVERVNGPWALLAVEVRHAYRHQIRVHLASIGHPIAGDALYGGPRVASLGARHALHASYVAWAGDDVVPAFAVASDLPADLSVLGFGD